MMLKLNNEKLIECLVEGEQNIRLFFFSLPRHQYHEKSVWGRRRFEENWQEEKTLDTQFSLTLVAKDSLVV